MQNVVLPADLDARKSGSFKIGGEIEIHRLGFGDARHRSWHLGPAC